MKIRSGFVSNSSSSSFICDVCGREESGYDISLCDCEMRQCRTGHTFCVDESVCEPADLDTEVIRKMLIEDEKKRTWRKPDEIERKVADLELMSADQLAEEAGEISDYEVPNVCCPVCQMQVVTDADMLKYLIKKQNATKKELVVKIQTEFDEDYTAFSKFLKEE